MIVLYNCKRADNADHNAYRITKFTSDFEVESSYLCTVSTCECPAGHRPKCRHREMLPKFIQRGYVDTNFFFDYDRGGWVQMAQEQEPSTLESDKAMQMPDDLGDEYLRGIMNREEFQPEPEPSPELTIEEEEDEANILDDEEIANMPDGIEKDNALAPAGLGQASEPEPYGINPMITKELPTIREHNEATHLRNQQHEKSSPLQPSSSPTIRRRV